MKKLYIFCAATVLAAVSVAQDLPTPTVPTITVVMRNLDNPRGLAFGPEGALYINGSEWRGSVDFHEVTDQALDLAVLNDECVAKLQVQETAAFLRGANRALGDDDIILFRHARDSDGGTANESIILNFSVECFLADHVKRAGDFPFHVIRKAGQDLHMVAFPEAVHVLLHDSLVLSHPGSS
jgi:hypothetical protein